MRPEVRGRVRHALAIVSGLAALAPLTSQGAFAQTIPSYGTHAHCQRLAGFGGTFSRSVYGSCLNVEQSAALALQGRWSSIPESVRERCDRIASFGGSASYSILQNCVDVELAAPTASGPPAVGGTARFYLVTSEGGQGSRTTLSPNACRPARKRRKRRSASTDSASADRRCKSRRGWPPRGQARPHLHHHQPGRRYGLRWTRCTARVDTGWYG